MSQIELTKGFCFEIPDLADLFDNIKWSADNEKSFKTIPNTWARNYDGQMVPEVQKVLERLDLKIAHTYISEKVGSHGYGRHCDDVDVWFWQCHGKTKWLFDNRVSYILEPGDLLLIPANSYHEVVSLTAPRAGISMSKT